MIYWKNYFVMFNENVVKLIKQMNRNFVSGNFIETDN